jgi:putative sterol carrier protein
MTLDELFDKVNEKAATFTPGEEAPDARILLDIEGPDPRKWLASFESGKGAIRVWAGEAADVTVTVPGDTLLAVAEGRLSTAKAFLTGKVRIEGDMDLAMNLGRLWPGR